MEETINDRIRMVFEKLNITQKEFSKICEISQPTLSLILKGKQSINHNFLKILVSKFHINANWLLTGKGEIEIGETSLCNNASYVRIVESYSLLSQNYNDLTKEYNKLLIQTQKNKSDETKQLQTS